MSIPGFDIQQYRDSVTLADKDYTDWHSKISIVFGSLLESEYNWGRDEWTSYTMSQETLDSIRNRINDRIEQEYFFLELGTLPVKRFSMRLVSKLNSIMATLGPLYEAMAKGVDITKVTSSKNISREVESEYPQSQLAPTTSDYASNATESAQETTGNLALLEIFERFPQAFRDPDSVVLEYIRPCFSYIYSANF